jgi:hypothetical protein
MNMATGYWFMAIHEKAPTTVTVWVHDMKVSLFGLLAVTQRATRVIVDAGLGKHLEVA